MDDNRTWYEKFKTNTEFLWHRAVTWATTFWTSAEILWNAIPDDSRNSLVGYLFAPKYVSLAIGVFAFISFILANGWPQPKLAAKVMAKIEQNPQNSQLISILQPSANMPLDNTAKPTDHA